MSRLNDLAIFLVAAWKTTYPDKRIPTAGGTLHAAIEAVADTLPSEFHGALTFGDTRIGRRCFELEAVMAFARDAELITDPNPSYKTSQVAISANSASRLLNRVKQDIDIAKQFAQRLNAAVEAAEQQQASEGVHPVAA